MEVFFTSDLHIGHENLVLNGWRPFSTVEEHREAIIDNWNAVVGSDDTVYVLGTSSSATGQRTFRKSPG